MDGFLSELRRRWQAMPPLVGDVALVLTVSAVELFNLYRVLIVHDCPCELPFPLASLIVLLTTVPLLWRRSAPFLVINVIGPATVAASILDVPLLLFGALVGVFTVSALSTPGKRKIVLGLVVVSLIATTLVERDFESLPEDVVTFGAAWVLGILARTRRAYIGELEHRAEQLERERDDRARLAVAEERARIARELHDVVAHSMGVMVVQTQAARSVLMRDQAKADEALEKVETVGRRNLGEIRKLLGLLRLDEEEATLAPQPGLDQMPELMEYFRSAGLDIDVHVRGSARAVDRSVDISSYRILQEALTNVLKHSSSKRADVTVTWDDSLLRIEISNEGDGTALSNGSVGHGIAGMRERASLVAGTVAAGPRPDGGFRVIAELPVSEST
jgi:signal transduction histidine kinase